MDNYKLRDLLNEADGDIFHKNVKEAFEGMGGSTWLSELGEERSKKEFSEESMTEAGRENGRRAQPLPPTNASSPVDVEQRLIEFAKEWHTEMKGMFEYIAKSIFTLMGNAKTNMESFNNLVGHSPGHFYASEHSAEAAREELGNRKYTITTAELKVDLENYREALNIFRNFREDHQLDRKPDYPPSEYATILLLGVCIFFESIFNAYFYSSASDAGFVGGVITAVVISLFIVLISAFSGYLFTYINAADIITKPLHDTQAQKRKRKGKKKKEARDTTTESQKPKKIFYLLLSAICFLIVVALIMIAATYRDVAYLLKTTEDTEILEALWERLASFDILPKGSIESFLLILVNLVIFGISAYKGYHWNDIIPGYKEKSEDFSEARDTYKRKIEDVWKSIPSADDLKIKKYDRESMESLAKKYRLGCEHLQSLKGASDTSLNRIQEAIKARLDNYRIANIEERDEKINPPPDYFKEYPEFDGITVKAKELEQELIDKFEENIDRIVDVLNEDRQETIKTIQKGYDELYKETIKSHEIKSREYTWEENRRDPREGSSAT